MTRLRLLKILRDLWLAKFGSAAMVVAIGAGVLALGAVLSSKAILDREIARNYLQTYPASATFDIRSGIDNAALAAVRALPDVAEAAARSSAFARFRVGKGPWRPLLVFAVAADDPLRIARFTPQEGRWPPPLGGLFMERSTLEYFGVKTGQGLRVLAPGGAERPFAIAGSVHDPALAPSFQETIGYAYMTPEAFATLGEPRAPNQLKIIVGTREAPSGDRRAIEAVARRVAATLSARGIAVEGVAIPPPLRHPHQSQMDAVTTLLLVFSIIALALAAVLTATMIDSLFAQHIRQIGVMKTIGARTGQVFAMYLSMTALLAVAGTALALAPGFYFGRVLARVVARLLNIDLISVAVPVWVSVTVVAAGIALPVLIALLPLVRGSRTTVRRAIDESGVSAAGASRWAVRLTAFGGVNRATRIAARNMFRRSGRLALTLLLLAAAGAMFLAGINTARGWSDMVSEGMSHRRFDAEVRLERGAAPATLEALARTVPGVVGADAWTTRATSVGGPDTLAVRSTYPDGGHGSFALVALPPQTPLVRLPLRAGRWLRDDDTDAVVLNHLVAGAQVGHDITLTLEGRVTRWRIVGIVSDFGSPASAYVNAGVFAARTGLAEDARVVHVVTARHDAASVKAVIDALEPTFAARGFEVRVALPASQLREGLDGHVLVLVDILLALAVVMAVVGLLGLATTLSAGVVERTREFGIMRAVGASAAVVRGIVVTEGLLTAIVSIAFALVLSVPLTAILGHTIGTMAFRTELPLHVSFAALLAWLLIVVLGATAATAAPARSAARLTVREVLAHL